MNPIDPSTPAPPSAGAPLPPHVEARVKAWTDQLLDLTLKNSLLNLRLEGKRVLSLTGLDAAGLENALASGKEVTIRAANATGRAPATAVSSALNEEELLRRAIAIDTEARHDLEEGGAWTLYAAIGLLRWYEADSSGQLRTAPLLLVPVRLAIDRPRRTVKVAPHDDDTLGNPTLVEYLRGNFGIQLDALASLKEAGPGVDVAATLQGVREAIARHPRWSVDASTHLGLFAFQKLIMWRDLRANGARLLASGVARVIAEKPRARYTAKVDPVDRRTLDQSSPTADVPLILDADSTQLSAVVTGLRGESFVVQGPPGTGKSQTIANLIGAAMGAGKRVLFVSEKMAALTVVHERLERAGLGPFCLALHSRETKAQVMASLRRAWDQADPSAADGTGGAWEAKAAEVDVARHGLNEYAQALHAPIPTGESYRLAAARLLSPTLATAPRVNLDPSVLRAMTDARLARLLRQGDDFAAAADKLGPLQAHPFRDCEPTSASAAAVNRLATGVSQLRDAIDEITGAKGEIEARAEVADAGSIETAAAIATWIAAVADHRAPSSVASPATWEGAKRCVAEVRRASDANDAACAEISSRWKADLAPYAHLEPRIRAWIGRFWLFAWFALFGVRAALEKVARGRLASHGAIADDLARSTATRDQQARVRGARADLARSFEGTWDGADLPTIGAVVDRTDALLTTGSPFGARATAAARAIFATSASDPARDQARRAAQRMIAAIARLHATTHEVLEASSIARAARWSPSDRDALARAASLVEAWAGRTDAFRDLALFRERAAELEASGCGHVVASHAIGAIAPGDVHRAIERAVLDHARAAAEDARPVLRKFQGGAHHARVADFRARDLGTQAAARARIAAQLRARIPPRRATAQTNAGETAVLENELRKIKRHMPVRKLLQKVPTLVDRLKPCLMMSPLSVAQYLPPEPGLFDLLVFDEASQIPVPDAIGAIARAKQVVVVGDSRQMPPTRFFRSQMEGDAPPTDDNDDAQDSGDLESVLDEALAAGLPEVRLGWHYRSRHDSLIAFSNANLYENKLEVFPSATRESDSLGIELVGVRPGGYEGGGVNREEAQALVAHLCTRLRAHAPGTRSFGVVTFSAAQQGVIGELLEAERARDRVIDAHCASGVEPVFVKNLENVQGDERDEILFSIAYGRDARGGLRMSFGPLNGTGGERRLNVATTRARCRMTVFSTLTAADLDLPTTAATGAKLLRDFLRYAEQRGPSGPRGESMSDAFDSDFERQVYDAIRALGHQAHTQVGSGGYRIDLAIVDRATPGQYVLAVECDGKAYHSGATARDRDRLRQSVLEGLGWRMHRVWSTDWWYGRDREIARLRDAIEEARRAAAFAPKTNEPVDEADLATATVATRETREPVRLPRSSITPTPASALVVPRTVRDGAVTVEIVAWTAPALAIDGADPRSYTELAVRGEDVDAVHDLVHQSGPLHRDEVARCLVKAIGGEKLTTKWQVHLDRIVKGTVGEVDRRGEYLWPDRLESEDLWTVRVPVGGAARDLDLVCEEEIAAAHAAVLMEGLSMPTEALHRATARLFGVKAVGRKVAERLDAGVAALVRRGVAEVVEGGVRWVG